jgi:flagellar assembly protein FliH
MSKPFSTEEDNIKHWVLPEVSGKIVGVQGGDMRPQTVEDIEAVYEEGRKQGYEAGKAEALAEAKKIAGMLRFLQQPLKQLDEDVEHQLTELALTVGRLLLKKECSIDASHIQNIIHEALDFLPLKSRNIRVRLNPADIQLMKDAGDDPASQEWACVADNSVTQGGCQIESDQSHIDASLETRVQQLVDQLKEHQSNFDEGQP